MENLSEHFSYKEGTYSAKADTDIGFNEYLSDWMKGSFEAGYKEGYRDALASLHYKPDDGSGKSAVMHLQ